MKLIKKLLLASAFSLAFSCQDQSVLLCKETRSEGFRSCTQHASHPRASCFKSVERDYATCILSAGLEQCSIETTCKAECLFSAITCDEWNAKTNASFDCLAEQQACEQSCINIACNM